MAAVMKLQVSAASVTMGALVGGVDLAGGISADQFTQLHELLLEHHLLVLPGQDLSAVELEEFGRLWGELLIHPAAGRHRDTDYVQRLAGKNAMFRFFHGTHPFGGGWHSDMTWHPTPPAITALHAQRMPAAGGNTIFANQHVAYETLDEATQAQLDGLTAFHSGKIFGPDVPDSVHPVVRTHDESGKKALFVNPNFTKHIEGMDENESLLLLYRLMAHAARPEFTYRHEWDAGDLVLWDNRSVMHYAITDYVEKRIMHRITVQGGKPV